MQNRQDHKIKFDPSKATSAHTFYLNMLAQENPNLKLLKFTKWAAKENMLCNPYFSNGFPTFVTPANWPIKVAETRQNKLDEMLALQATSIRNGFVQGIFIGGTFGVFTNIAAPRIGAITQNLTGLAPQVKSLAQQLPILAPRIGFAGAILFTVFGVAKGYTEGKNKTQELDREIKRGDRAMGISPNQP